MAEVWIVTPTGYGMIEPLLFIGSKPTSDEVWVLIKHHYDESFRIRSFNIKRTTKIFRMNKTIVTITKD